MNQNLDNYLVEKYPKIFVDRYESMQKTAICYGFVTNAQNSTGIQGVSQCLTRRYLALNMFFSLNLDVNCFPRHKPLCFYENIDGVCTNQSLDVVTRLQWLCQKWA